MPSYPLPFELALASLHLSVYHKSILEHRYSKIVREMKGRARRLAAFFHVGRTIITVGSLIVPALLSVQGPEATSPHTATIYWSTWVISLLVTMCNALIAMIKLDKRYYLVHTTLELLISEGWQYLELTGKYSGFHTPGVPPTHENQFVFFCHAVEKIRMRQVEEEYYKLSELHGQGATAAAHGGRVGAINAGTGVGSAGTGPAPAPTANLDAGFNNLIPPTPLQGELARLSPDILRAVQRELSNIQVEDAVAAGAAEPPPQQQPQNTENR